jgi:hypothetical protein
MTPLPPPLLQASVIIWITSLNAFSSSAESTVYQLIHSKANNFRIPSPPSSIKPGKAILIQRTIAHGICTKSYCCLPGVESREIGEHRVCIKPRAALALADGRPAVVPSGRARSAFILSPRGGWLVSLHGGTGSVHVTP